MAKEFSLEDGKELIKLARKSIEYASASGARLSETTEKKHLMENRGIFVTLHSFPKKELRGCIGFPYPILPLWNAVIDAAVEAAFNDPRFPPVQSKELEKIVLEISILSLPEEIKGDRIMFPEQIKIGEDGLIIQKGPRSGLLLPQVATEYSWNPETFLENCCSKAGLPTNTWKQKDCKVLKFQAQIFSEKAPGKEVEEL